jgi:molybdopterin molybdotransferase
MNDIQNLIAPSCRDDHDAIALPLEIALHRILDAVAPLPPETFERVPLLGALDRVLVRNVVATIDVPPHDNAAMDGYALHAADLPKEGTRTLSVVGTAVAGRRYLDACNHGECVRIMTGAVIPEETDTVVLQEHVERLDATTIRIDGRTRAGENVRAAGEDIRCGATVLTEGRRLKPADMGSSPRWASARWM